VQSARKQITSLAACPPWGAEPRGSSRGLLNEVKHRVPDVNTPTRIDLGDIPAIQEQADRLVESGRTATVTEADRAKLRDLGRDGRRFSEGDLVALVGFLVGRAKANLAESANCHLPGASNNDFELWIARAPGASPYDAIVAEMIPQGRPVEWTLRTLHRLAIDGTQVQVVGQLMFDTEHVPNPRPGAAPGLPRMSIWEIHPVTKFMVCGRGTGCDPAQAADWKPLKDLVNR
jgi:hypothetical protein